MWTVKVLEWVRLGGCTEYKMVGIFDGLTSASLDSPISNVTPTPYSTSIEIVGSRRLGSSGAGSTNTTTTNPKCRQVGTDELSLIS